MSEKELTYECLTDVEKELVDFLNGLDPRYRHSFTLVCRGNQPAGIHRIDEHRDHALTAKSN